MCLAPTGLKEGIGSPGTGAPDSSELEQGAGNLTHALWRGSLSVLSADEPSLQSYGMDYFGNSSVCLYFYFRIWSLVCGTWS